uniref:Uncharacterized protein n=1 Tax=Anguilla anguilla TaxID=7936 RepID=A0A0E9XPY5_ANGAN
MLYSFKRYSFNWAIAAVSTVLFIYLYS